MLTEVLCVFEQTAILAKDPRDAGLQQTPSGIALPPKAGSDWRN
jgi:hypothetical protein